MASFELPFLALYFSLSRSLWLSLSMTGIPDSEKGPKADQGPLEKMTDLDEDNRECYCCTTKPGIFCIALINLTVWASLATYNYIDNPSEDDKDSLDITTPEGRDVGREKIISAAIFAVCVMEWISNVLLVVSVPTRNPALVWPYLVTNGALVLVFAISSPNSVTMGYY